MAAKKKPAPKAKAAKPRTAVPAKRPASTKRATAAATPQNMRVRGMVVLFTACSIIFLVVAACRYR